MLSGIYHNSTKIFFGDEYHKNIGDILVSYNANNILVVTGNRSYVNNNLGIIIEESIKQKGLKYIKLQNIVPGTHSNNVYDGISLCQKHHIDFILGVGGGSVIDTAKAIAIGSLYEGDFFDFFERKIQPKKSIPTGCILTISGTGAESSDGAVITKDGKKYSCGGDVMKCKFAILNPQFSTSVPKFQTNCGIVDSISHILERYFSHTENITTSDYLCEGLILSLMKNSALINSDLTNVNVRADIMWAQKIAHDNTVGFGRKQDWATHTIAHEIELITKNPHGSILAVVFPAWMTFCSTRHPEKFLKFSKNIFNNKNGNDNDMVEKGINDYKYFLGTLDMPKNLRELGITDKNLMSEFAYKCSLTTMSGTIGNFMRLTQEQVIKILEIAY